MYELIHFKPETGNSSSLVLIKKKLLPNEANTTIVGFFKKVFLVKSLQQVTGKEFFCTKALFCCCLATWCVIHHTKHCPFVRNNRQLLIV